MENASRELESYISQAAQHEELLPVKKNISDLYY